jgi:hypothetical protein
MVRSMVSMNLSGRSVVFPDDLVHEATMVRLAWVAPLLVLVSCQSVQGGDPKEWGDPERVDELEAGALRPQVAFDPMGHAIAVWDQTDPETLAPGAGLETSDDIWLSRTRDDGSWGSPLRLEQNEPGDSVFPGLGIDGEGNALVTFLQSQEVQGNSEDPPAQYFRVWAVRYDAVDGRPAEALCIQSTASDSTCDKLEFSGDAGPPQIAVDSEGNALVVWHQGGNGEEPSTVWSNRYVAGSSWEDAQELAPSDTSDLLKPQIAMDAEGNGIAVWEQLNRGNQVTSIWSSRYRVQTGQWDDPQPVEVDDGNAFDPRVTADVSGNAIAVWVQQQEGSDGGAPFLPRASRYLASTRQWEPPTLIGPQGSSSAEAPRVAIDGEGRATAVWVQSEGVLSGVWSNRYEVDAGWGTAAPIGPTGLGPARTPQIAASALGDAVAVWVQFDGVQDSIWSNRYTTGAGWTTSEAIEKADDIRCSGPAVAVDFSGDANALWTTFTSAPDTFGDLWSNRLIDRPVESDTR